MSASMTDDGWQVRVVDVDTALNSIADAEAALDKWHGSRQRRPWMWSTWVAERVESSVIRPPEILKIRSPALSVAQMTSLVEATGTVVIPEDGDYIFGFNGDDGGILCVDGADFTLANRRWRTKCIG